ncbi:MAG TPA: Clp protease N-terminal domain-containing protein [Kineosporiaceae bacterium]|nr:Clp protease N-terminal domain-containing protein [Kineosporiaceae bacterium]
MFERFTDQARAAVVRARDEAGALRHPVIGTEHLLLALFDPATGATAALLRQAGLDAESVRAAIRQHHAPTPRSALTDEDAEALRSIGIDLQAVLSRLEEALGAEALAPAPAGEGRRGLFRRRRPAGPVSPRVGRVPFTARAKKVLELSLREAIALRHGRIGSEHILLGLLREGDGLAATVLAERGVDVRALRAATLRSLDEAA